MESLVPYTHVFTSAMDAKVTDHLLDLTEKAAPVRLTTFIKDAERGCAALMGR